MLPGENQIPLLNRRGVRLLLHVAIWLVALGLHTMAFLGQLPWDLLLLRSVLNIGLLAVVFYVNLFLLRKFFLRQRYWAYAIYLAGLFLTTAFLRAHFNMQLTLLPARLPRLSMNTALLIAAFVTNVSILMVSIFYALLQYYYRKEAVKQRLEQERSEAELQFLKAQINPHFLFNTLNNIYALSVTGSSKTADMVLRLSELLRYVIYDGAKDRVSLEKEVRHLEEFINLFKMRMEQDVDLTFTYSGEMAGKEVEPLMLMPLVENCFKHCDFDLNENAYAHIELKVEDNYLWFSTRNSVDRQHEQKDKVGGVGLSNMRKRLRLRYPGAHVFEIVEGEAVFEVRLKLPLAG